MTILMTASSGSSLSQAQQTAQIDRQADRRRVDTNLSYRYGSIGIEAVAAAVRYAGTGKNPAYAPVVSHTESSRYENAV
jgi:hypothetical protein